MSSQQIYVSIDLGDATFKVGKLWFHQRGARQSASFEYEPGWLKHSEKFALDPALQLTEGAFHTTPDQILFGAIGDSAPDRWGRVLMRRAESARAKSTGEAMRTLLEADYLLGVNTATLPEFQHNKTLDVWKSMERQFGLRTVDDDCNAYEMKLEDRLYPDDVMIMDIRENFSGFNESQNNIAITSLDRDGDPAGQPAFFNPALG